MMMMVILLLRVIIIIALFKYLLIINNLLSGIKSVLLIKLIDTRINGKLPSESFCYDGF